MDVSKHLFALNVFLKSNDILTTTLAIILHGAQAEANPLVRYSIEIMGLAPAMLFNFIIFYLLMISLVYKRSTIVLTFVSIISAAVVVNNIIGLMTV